MESLNEAQESQSNCGGVELARIGFAEKIEGKLFLGAKLSELLLMKNPILITAGAP